MEKKKKLYCVANAHLDTQWNRTIQDTIRDSVKNTLEQNFALFEKYPHYRMNFEGAFRYKLAKEYYPDLYEILKTRRGERETHDSSVRVSRIVIVVMMVIVVIYCYVMPKDIIAKATSLFMGMTAAALLPAYFHALYSKNPSRDAALASIAVGTVVYIFLALFINSGLSIFLPICKMITGQAVLMPDSLIAYVDPLIIALPISIITMAVVLLAKKDSKTVS